MSDEVEEFAECRGCGMRLSGKPFYMGGSAYHPRTGDQAKVNFYGGFVCSRECDYASSRELEASMPGSSSGFKSLSTYAQQSINRNWG